MQKTLKIRSVIMLLVISAFIIVAVPIGGPAIKAIVDGYIYQVDVVEGKAYIVDYKGPVDKYVASSHIGIWKVGSVAEDVLSENSRVSEIKKDGDADYMLNCKHNRSLTKVVYGKGTSYINDVFYSCTYLDEVIIPEGTEGISGLTFQFCGRLNDVIIPKSMKYIGSGAFEGTKFELLHKKDEYYVVGDHILLFYNGDKEIIAVPDGIKQISNWVLFKYDEQELVRSIYIPESVESYNGEVPPNTVIFFGNEEIKDLYAQNIEGLVVAPKGSYMEKFCQENNLNFREMTEEEHAIWEQKTKSVVDKVVYG